MEYRKRTQCYLCFYIPGFIEVPPSDVGTNTPLAALLPRSSLNDQTEHILSRRRCWRVLRALLRGRSTFRGLKGTRGSWVSGQNTHSRVGPNSVGGHCQPSAEPWARAPPQPALLIRRVLSGTGWIRLTVFNAASGVANGDMCCSQLSQLRPISFFNLLLFYD